MNRQRDPEQRRIFRRMEWLFVWGPPIATVLVASAGSLVLAALVPLEGTTFWGRWALAMLILLVAPVLVFLARQWLRR